MSIFKCKMCGGTIEFEPGATVGECDSCGTKQTLPRLDDDKKANLYDRANHFRRNNDFDKAMSIYEQILNEDNTDAEAYWSLVLCRYGIEYVEDPTTRKQVPTVNRTQYTSVFADEDYKSAIKCADGYQKVIYEEEAKAIDEIQKGILAISQKEKPFDVFICYKETDNNGRRSQDSVLANDLYHQLTQEGFKVFFSRITLEDKLGTAYEPYIFAALNSAKVMVVLGTKAEYFNAVWVKNEWSRYLALIRNGAKKVLIPAYRDMDPYDLPEEFSHLQAQDMSKLGFMQDLIRGIKKIIGSDTPKETVKEPVAPSSGTLNIAPLLRRVLMFLEDGNWREADEYCEKVLDQEPENAQAYLGKLMAELRVHKQDELKNCDKPFDDRNNYQKTLRFAEPALADELKGYITFINDRNENERLNGIYDGAVSMMQDATTESAYRKAAAAFQTIPGFKDSDILEEECLEKAEISRKDTIYYSGQRHMIAGGISEYEAAKKDFQSIPGWKDADEQVIACEKKIEEIKAKAEADRLEAERKAEERRIADEKAAKKRKRNIAITAAIVCVGVAVVFVWQTVIIPQQQYHAAEALLEEGDYDAAVEAFTAMGDYKDSAERILEVQYAKAEALLEAGDNETAIEIFTELGEYSDSGERIAEVYYAGAEAFLAVGDDVEAAVLFSKAGDYSDAYDRCMELWNQRLVRSSLAAGYSHTVALKSDGTVLAVGSNKVKQCDVSGWMDIVAITAGANHTVGLKSDGTVVAVGSQYDGRCDVSGWTDIVAIGAGLSHSVGLKSDGTVVSVGLNSYGQCNVSNWNNIAAIAGGQTHTVGLKADGTVVAVGSNDDGQCDVSGWTDIVEIAAGGYHTVGLKSDGTVVAVGYNPSGQCDVSDWTDIVAISAGSNHTVGLKSDGTVVAIGENVNGQCDVTNWSDIVSIATGYYYTFGLKSDGTVVAVGKNYDGQCEVSDWTDIKIPE